MSPLRLTLASLLYYRRSNFAVACGVAVCTAVLTGALLVGDSMRGSLLRLTLDRLGRINEVLLTNHFFRAALADQTGQDAVPAILLQVSLENADSQPPCRANRVELIGCDRRFWQFGNAQPRRLPGPGEIVLNRPAAERLGLHVGDDVLLRLPSLAAIPADSALGKKRETVRTQRVTVREIIAATGLGAFGLQPTQRPPLNAYVSLDWLAARLDQPGRVNAILVAGKPPAVGMAVELPSPSAGATVQLPHQPQLAPGYSDYGLRVERTPLGYCNITSDRMMIDPGTAREILKGLRAIPDVHLDIQPTMTYLANTLACHGREVPYSTITAIDFAAQPPLGPFRSIAGKPLPPLKPDEIALNSWTAEQLHARVGDTVRLAYFEPESLDGQVREKTVSLRLAAVVQLAAAADDRSRVPSVKGMTDELTMAKWDPPFPFDAKRIRPDDEKYWDRYGPTPKAFVSLSTGRRLWASRFGDITSLRVVSVGGDSRRRSSVGGDSRRRSDAGPNAIRDWSRLLQQHLDPAAFGFTFQSIRRQQLDAAKGATPFGVLFLCFSFFIIAAAVLLVALLFRLGIDRRAVQIGTLLALGLSQRQVRRMLLGEGLAVAAVGSLLGVLAGIGYAALMLLGLQTCWLAAVATPFLQLHLTALSLAIGYASGVAVAGCAIWLSLRRIARVPPRRLLAGATSRESPWLAGHGNGKRTAWIELALVLLTVAPTATLLLTHFGEEMQTEMFFAAGTTALLTLLALVWLRLRAGMTGQAVAAGRGNLARMALRNAARNPGRSTLTIGLVAAASFVIVSMDAFRLDPTQQTPALHSGNGGFALVAESDQPILQNLNSPDVQTTFGFSAADRKLLAGSTIVSLRLHGGQDASCLNLYRSRQPRMLGLPRQFIDRDGFAWADTPRDCTNPWQLLDIVEQPSRLLSAAGETPARRFQAGETPAPQSLAGETPALQSAVPVILEKNTANYALQLWGGLGETFEIDDGRGNPVRLRVVALLADSIFQGDLLIGESDFLRLFPDTAGRRFFLVETPPERIAAVKNALQQNLGDYGFSAETTGRRLAEFLAVQNTYLSTFQSLGGLGLLLGTFGLAAVQLRNVFERRGELALLRATGFRRATLGWLVLLEHAVLLTTGLAVGTLAAVLAVLPHLLHRAAAAPWASLAVTLLAVLLVGLAAGALAVRAVVRAPLLAALREERG